MDKSIAGRPPRDNGERKNGHRELAAKADATPPPEQVESATTSEGCTYATVRGVIIALVLVLFAVLVRYLRR